MAIWWTKLYKSEANCFCNSIELYHRSCHWKIYSIFVTIKHIAAQFLFISQFYMLSFDHNSLVWCHGVCVLSRYIFNFKSFTLQTSDIRYSVSGQLWEGRWFSSILYLFKTKLFISIIMNRTNDVYALVPKWRHVYDKMKIILNSHNWHWNFELFVYSKTFIYVSDLLHWLRHIQRNFLHFNLQTYGILS